MLLKLTIFFVVICAARCWPVKDSPIQWYNLLNVDTLRDYLYSKYYSSPEAIPEHFDWRELSSVTGVKDQGDCSAGWAFAAVAAIEGQYAIVTGNLFAFSEQQIIDCSTSYGNNGCNSGSIENAYDYVINNGGIDSELFYLYEGFRDVCRFKRKKIGAQISNYTKILPGDEQSLLEAVAKIGPIAVTVDASSEKFRSYTSGVFDDPSCGKNGSHGVTVIGYGTDKHSGEQYWLVKNSWGEKWGENGYIRMARNKDNQCGIASDASYPVI